MPAISILLPTYNGAQFLEEQLDSILAQSFEDFELVSIDDGSNDASAEILRAYADRDSRVRVLASDGNKGQKTRLKELLAEASTPLIAISDQDDIWGPQKLERLYENLDGCSLAFGPSHLIDGAGDPLGKTLMEALNVAHHGDDRVAILRSSRVSAHAMLCRREIIDEELFSSKLAFDWVISLIAAFSDGVRYVPDADTFHRLHGGNAHNGGVLKMLRPWTITLGDIERRITRFKAKRGDLIEQFDQMAAASALAPEIRSTFARCAALCRENWGDAAMSYGGEARDTFLALRELLLPLAGSERDWEHFEVHLWPICLGLPRQASYVLSPPN
ncbi:glycosyltransferase [Erythrobacter sp. W53]|uniref:glycosyltransferase n=1 Tax=Erythrobacteraceae TaxID=335929 RepID=UPI0036D2CD0F